MSHNSSRLTRYILLNFADLSVKNTRHNYGYDCVFCLDINKFSLEYLYDILKCKWNKNQISKNNRYEIEKMDRKLSVSL